MPRQSPFHIDLTSEERRELENRARKYTSPYRDVVRAKLILLAAEGLSNDAIAGRLGTPRQIVSKWRRRFFDQRLASLGLLFGALIGLVGSAVSVGRHLRRV